jgi:4-amino-4-deoxy-L-arabinose transferase-like glycosyltransferase
MTEALKRTDGSADKSAQPAMRLKYLFVFLFSLLLGASGLAGLPPIDRDEARFVQATRQMIETGNYVDIRLQQETRYKKPIGIYWLQSAAVALSGQGAAAPIWVYRLVSLLGVALAALAAAWTGTRLFGGNAGLAAGLVVAAIFATAFEGRVAKTDAALLACCVAAQGALAQIYVAARRGRPSAGWLPWLFWSAQGAAMLIKGPIAPLLSALTVVVLFAFERDGRWLKGLKAGRGVLLAALIVLPWLALITWKSGAAFWQEAVGRDMLGKVAQGQESHGLPPGFYVLTYSLFLWPFGLAAIGAGLQALNRVRENAALRFCLAWYIPFWLLFELIPTKLPHYMLPAYPALALLVGWLAALEATDAERPLRRWQVWLRWATVFGHLVVTLALAALAVGAPIYLMGRFEPWSVPAAVAILAAGWLGFPRGLQMPLSRIGAAAAAAGIAFSLLFGTLAPRLSPLWLSPRIVAAVRANQPCGTTALAAAGYHEPSLVFLAGTDTVLTDADGAARHLLADPACAMALVPKADGPALEAVVSAAGRQALAVAGIAGINYSSGDALDLELYRVAGQ